MNRYNGKWKELPFKDKLAYVTCIASFLCGWLMCWLGFIVSPLGEISDGVLWVLGQALIYTASVLGISMYVTRSIGNIRHELGLKNEEDIINTDDSPIDE